MSGDCRLNFPINRSGWSLYSGCEGDVLETKCGIVSAGGPHHFTAAQPTESPRTGGCDL